MIFRIAKVLLVWPLLLCSCAEKKQAPDGTLELRMGHFPNITHVQGLVAHYMTRTGKGWYERRVSELTGRPVRVIWSSYNAGPSAMEAIFAHSLDFTYVGPAPAINAWVKARGRELRLIAGAVKGGSALIVPRHSAAKSPADFRGKILATPQLGNTQDVSCRAWLKSGGLRVLLTGGDATVMPTRNAEQLALFAQGRFAGVWTVEPWVSRLEQAGGRVLVEDQESLTTVLAASERFLLAHPQVAEAVLIAHRELTQWIVDHPEEARQMVIDELKALTMTSFDPELVRTVWQRIHLADSLELPLLQRFVREAHQAGFLRSEPNIAPIIQTHFPQP